MLTGLQWQDWQGRLYWEKILRMLQVLSETEKAQTTVYQITIIWCSMNTILLCSSRVRIHTLCIQAADKDCNHKKSLTAFASRLPQDGGTQSACHEHEIEIELSFWVCNGGFSCKHQLVSKTVENNQEDTWNIRKPSKIFQNHDLMTLNSGHSWDFSGDLQTPWPCDGKSILPWVLPGHRLVGKASRCSS